MRAHDIILKMVVFVGVLAPGLSEGRQELGTGFIVMIDFANSSLKHPYLVTAKHVAEGAAGKTLSLRVNHKSGQAVYVNDRDGNTKWLFHPDQAVDIAVHPWIYPEFFDIVGMNIKDFTGNLGLQDTVGLGDEVLIVGLFAKAYGDKRNMPIVRMGNLAMIPEDKLRTVYGLAHVYLIEARSIGGISGSPVLIRPTLAAEFSDGSEPYFYGTGSYKLLGLIHGHWDVNPDDLNKPDLEYQRQADGGINLGIAQVTPAYKLMEILMQPELVEIRQKTEADVAATQARKNPPPTMDIIPVQASD